MFLMRIPLFVIVLIVFNALMLFSPDLIKEDSGSIFSFTLISGATYTARFNDFLILFAVIILYLELFKATRTAVSSIMDHMLSMFVFIAFLIEFLVVPACGTSTFLILTMLSLLDVVAGFTITISTARRDMNFGPGTGT